MAQPWASVGRVRTMSVGGVGGFFVSLAVLVGVVVGLLILIPVALMVAALAFVWMLIAAALARVRALLPRDGRRNVRVIDRP